MKKRANRGMGKGFAAAALSLLLVLTACGARNTAGSFTKYACSSGEAPAAAAYVQLDINPSFIIGVTEDNTVVSIEANNEDAEDVLTNYMSNYFSSESTGLPLEAVIRDLAEATKQGGYIEDTFAVEVSVLSGDVEEAAFEEACQQAAGKLSEEDGIAASFQWEDSEQEGTVDSNAACPECSGKGELVCDLCNGQGSVTETEEREVEVRNDYVCPYCGGVGILDDGMHGGETAVCGYCGGEGKTGSMSGEFREKAFDTEIVEEEVSRTCPRCNGSGRLTCTACDGSGVAE